MKKKFEGILKGILSQEQTKLILGGYGEEGNSCGYRVYINGVEHKDCNVSQSVAQDTALTWGGNWCCAQCPQTTYCG